MKKLKMVTITAAGVAIAVIGGSVTVFSHPSTP